MHGSQSSRQVQCSPFAKRLELQIRPPASNLAPTVESVVAPLNIGLATAYHRAQNQQAWRVFVGMATCTEQAT